MNQVRGKYSGQVMIECPNTIFHLYVNDEIELTKIEIFMSNIRTVKQLGLTDIYNWCNRQGIAYRTRFNYHRGISVWENLLSYLRYTRQKMRCQMNFG